MVVFAYYEGSRGILVNPVDDTGALFTIDPGQGITAMKKDRIYKGIICMSRSRMYDHPLCFVDYEDIIILIKNVKRQFNRQNIRLF